MASIVLTGNMRIVIGVCGRRSLMIVAMLSYVMMDDLAWRPRSGAHQPLAGVVAK
jgi:hypothetical protein